MFKARASQEAGRLASRPLSAFKHGSFTLLEVLISLVILTVGIVFIFEYLFGFAAALNHLNNRAKAYFLLNQQRWEIAASIKEDSYLMARQDKTELGQTLFLTQVSLEDISDLNQLYKITTEISWKERGRARRLWREEYIRSR